MTKNTIGLILGPLLFVLMLFFRPAGMEDPARFTAATTLWMAVWWITECMPIAVTAMLPLIVFPLCGVMNIKQAGSGYSDPVIFLFIACFMLATAIEKWNLHRRIALNIIRFVGTKPSMVILGFMLATGFLSMWLSNTATTIMMLPIGLSLSTVVTEDYDDKIFKSNFTTVILLGIAYASSIGGIATLIGTPTNILFAGAVAKNFNEDISFTSWLIFAFPPTLILLFSAWFYMVLVFGIRKKEKMLSPDKDATNKIDNYLKEIGPLSFEEITVASVFGLAVLGWILRAFWLKDIIPNDAIIALIAMTILFMIPAGKKSKVSNVEKETHIDEDTFKKYPTILDWQTAVNIPWGIILLFGGGLSLATAFEVSGLAAWIGKSLTIFEILPFFLILLLVVTMVNFLTEITSNVATVSMVLPVLIAISKSLEIHPYYLMIGATCAASCAFMLPVATAPNAIVYGTEKIKIGQMIKSGFALNLISIVIYTLFIYYTLPLIWDLSK
jgi:sodium-dependent dicarboxylate transporter 2/3/5